MSIDGGVQMMMMPPNSSVFSIVDFGLAFYLNNNERAKAIN